MTQASSTSGASSSVMGRHYDEVHACAASIAASLILSPLSSDASVARRAGDLLTVVLTNAILCLASLPVYA
jgi:hypothetical protein